MSKNPKNRLAATIVASLAAALFVGCSSSTSTNDDTSPSDQATSPTVQSESSETTESVEISNSIGRSPLSPAECFQPGDACLNGLSVTSQLRLRYFGTHSLSLINPTVETAVILIPSDESLARNQFAILATEADRAQKASPNIILVPWFTSQISVPAPEAGVELVWKDNRWWNGAAAQAVNGERVRSFAAVEKMLDVLLDERAFPTLKRIVVLGDGLGGAFVHRFMAYSRAPEKALAQDQSIEFIAVNPDSFLYLDGKRARHHKGYLSEADFLNRVIPYCVSFTGGVNGYPYGLIGSTSTLSESGDSRSVRERILTRDFTILLGEHADKWDTTLDRSCAAGTQGADRMQRARIYLNYLLEYSEETKFPAIPNHRIVIIPDMGLLFEDILMTHEATDVIFRP